MDAMWLMKQMDSGKMSILECLAERESINRYCQMLRKFSQLKGLTVNVNLSDPPCKDGIVRFITAPLQTFSDHL